MPAGAIAGASRPDRGRARPGPIAGAGRVPAPARAHPGPIAAGSGSSGGRPNPAAAFAPERAAGAPRSGRRAVGRCAVGRCGVRPAACGLRRAACGVRPAACATLVIARPQSTTWEAAGRPRPWHDQIGPGSSSMHSSSALASLPGPDRRLPRTAVPLAGASFRVALPPLALTREAGGRAWPTARPGAGRRRRQARRAGAGRGKPDAEQARGLRPGRGGRTTPAGPTGRPWERRPRLAQCRR